MSNRRNDRRAIRRAEAEDRAARYVKTGTLRGRRFQEGELPSDTYDAFGRRDERDILADRQALAGVHHG